MPFKAMLFIAITEKVKYYYFLRLKFWIGILHICRKRTEKGEIRSGDPIL